MKRLYAVELGFSEERVFPSVSALLPLELGKLTEHGHCVDSYSP